MTEEDPLWQFFYSNFVHISGMIILCELHHTYSLIYCFRCSHFSVYFLRVCFCPFMDISAISFGKGRWPVAVSSFCLYDPGISRFFLPGLHTPLVQNVGTGMTQKWIV